MNTWKNETLEMMSSIYEDIRKRKVLYNKEQYKVGEARYVLFNTHFENFTIKMEDFGTINAFKSTVFITIKDLEDFLKNPDKSLEIWEKEFHETFSNKAYKYYLLKEGLSRRL